MKKWIGLVLINLFYFGGYAQQDSLPTINLQSVEITTLRIPTNSRAQPFSISTYTAGPLQATRQQLSLQEYLTEMPGVFSLNANNYAQDLRIAIRGFGARSAFGIRGVKIIVDGIPETTPDGQGQIDNLNIGGIESIEVLKGPSAALYGNASGGVINIKTHKNVRAYWEAGSTFGAFGMQQYQFKTRAHKYSTMVNLQATHTRSNGYREQSALESTNVNFRLAKDFSRDTKLSFQANYTNSPVGDDPGGLTLEEVSLRPESVRERNFTFQTGEAIQQFNTGLSFDHALKENTKLAIYGFYNRRQFEGRLPFNFGGWVDLNRNYFGQGGHFSWKKNIGKGKNTLQTGYEIAGQMDDRKRFRNEEGIQGELTLDQLEKFTNVGIYALDHFKLNKLLITLGLRFDFNRLALEDQKLDDEDQSGERNLPAFNPSLGINYELSKLLNLYANIRSGFETPSLSELSANPTGDAGFNEMLVAQRAFNYELGFKGFAFNRLDFDVALFYINTQNDLVPFEVAAFPDRSFFRNAGSGERTGVEMNARFYLNSKFNIQSSYTFSQFKYKDYSIPQGDFSGNFLPGIPKHFASLAIKYQGKKGLNIRLQHRYIDHIFADDSNQVKTDVFHLTDLSLGYKFYLKRLKYMPFFGVNNIFNTEYFDNIRLNAFGGRHYEAAPPVNIYGGIRIRWQKPNIIE